MKRLFLGFFLLAMTITMAHTQSIPSVGVVQFQFEGTGVTSTDAARLTSQVFEELNSWGTLNVLHGSAGVQFIIRAILTRRGANFILTGTSVDVSTGRTLNEYSELAQSIDGISIFQFCTKAVENIPLPNYLLGTWQSIVNMPDGPVVCIIEFNTNRTARIERYDTWEHKERNSLRYEGFGRGTYTYTGFANRIVTINANQVRIDAIASVNLTLEEALSAYSNVSRGNLMIIFNAERTSFDIVNNILPFGRNYDGPSVHPSEIIGFTRFVKIR